MDTPLNTIIIPGPDKVPALQIAGENVERNLIQYRESRGYIKQVVRGVYTRADLTPTQRRNLLRDHAPRIATTLFPDSVLYGPAAALLGHHQGEISVVAKGSDKELDVGLALTVKAHRSQDIMLMSPDIEQVLVTDSLGEFQVKRFSDLYTFACGFRRRTSSKALAPDMPPEILLDLSKKLLTPRRGQTPDARREELITELAALAQRSSIGLDLKLATKYLNSRSKSLYAENDKSMQSLQVFWHEHPVGKLSTDGQSWEFDYEQGVGVKLSLAETPESTLSHTVPHLLGAILTESAASDGTTYEQRLTEFFRASRYISNISVHDVSKHAVSYVPDVLEGRLENYHNDKLEFTGAVSEKLRGALYNPAAMREFRDAPDVPRISGMQAKLPCNLSTAGGLDLAHNKSFSHMLKLVSASTEYSSMCALEWYGLSIARDIGLNVERFAVADVGMPNPALVVERFDIRQNYNDRSYIIAEDFWSALGMREVKQKFGGNLLDVAKVVMEHSSHPSRDGAQLLFQCMVSWAMMNSDMHLKNILLLKEAAGPSSSFHSISLSPAYDMMCTQVYPGDPKTAALDIGLTYKRNHTLGAFVELGAALDLPEDLVVRAFSNVATKVATIGHRLSNNLPPVITRHQKSVDDIKLATQLIDLRCGAMLAEVDAYQQNRDAVLVHLDPRSPTQKEARKDAGIIEEVDPEGMRPSETPMSFDASDFDETPKERQRSSRRRP